MREIKIYLAKIAWSVNKWQGLPDKKEDYERNINNMAKDFKYVSENGLADEWWNFYERIDPKYYYWTTPKGRVSKLEDGGIVFFISKKGEEEKMYFVGVMGNCSETNYKVSLNQLLTEDQKNWVKNKIDITTKIINFKAKGEKNLSFVLNEYIQINQEEYFGVTLKQAEFTEIKEEYNNKLIELLEKTKGEKGNEELRGKIDKIINILKNKETGMKEVKEDKMSKWLEKIEEYITPELILKENYEEAIKRSERVAFLPVRPDWNEPRKMWGYYNPLTGLFYPTDGLNVLLNAFRDLVKNKDKERKHFIILDEMNLARVEYYMSDLLSLMENMTKVKEGKEIVLGETAQIHPLSKCVLSKMPEKIEGDEKEKYKKYVKEENGEIKWNIEGEKTCREECDKCPYKLLLKGEKPEKEDVSQEEFIKAFNPIPPHIAYPENLVIIGTVNVDETTFSFAPKVLDRAFVVEFNEVYVEEYCKEYEITDDTFINFVRVLNEILKPATLHFGYRVINEMWKYLEENGEKENPSDSSLDFLLKSKVLPKIHGTEERVGRILEKLMVYCFMKELKAYDKDKLEEQLKKYVEKLGGIERWWEKDLSEIAKEIKEEKNASPPSSDESSAVKEAKEESKKGEGESKKEEIKFFKDSANKIREMYARLKDTGYCSYF